LESVEQYLQEPFIDPVQDPVLANKRIADIAKYLRGQDGKHGIKRKKTNKKISLLDAAADIVARSKKPMTCPEIIAELPLKTRNNIKGKTPPRTLNSSIWKEIKTNGLNSRFCAVSGRKFMAY
jgi:predicted transcriptional regulator